MGYWKSKVLPKIKKVFEKDSAKKAAAAEATKVFDASKEDISKEFEEKKVELQPKVLEVYEASSAEIKTVVKEGTEAGLKKHSAAVVKFVEELVKIEFPGSKVVSEACSKYGPAYVPGPVLFVFEKVSTFIPVEEKPAEPEAEAPAPAVEGETAATTTSTEKEIVVEEAAAPAAAEAEKPAETPAAEPPAATEAPAAAKVEEAAPAAAAAPEAPKP
ncbi:unnamed protein product [Linum trigynum]|uniref:Plasma membrane-associated cation-binding protein 1 n=1 Tax=Linum trigynum TaxID=586398 RepID=A0AAV2FX39_9ROSI